MLLELGPRVKRGGVCWRQPVRCKLRRQCGSGGGVMWVAFVAVAATGAAVVVEDDV